MAPRKTQDAPADEPTKDDSFIQRCFDDAYSLRSEKDDLQTRIRANREILRNLHAAGYLNDEDVELLNTLYPPRARSEDEDAETNGDSPQPAPDASEPAPEPAPANA